VRDAHAYIEQDGVRHVLQIPIGRTVMEGARAASLRGIVAECGGACACATCHVFVAPDWAAKMPPIEEMENDMLDFFEGRDPACSRLSCQLRITEAFDGLTVTIAAA
jgi:2Fe-2S ferredoxin